MCQNIQSTVLVSEKRLGLDITIVKESVNHGDVLESVNHGDVLISWIGTDKQVADCLTKQEQIIID